MVLFCFAYAEGEKRPFSVDDEVNMVSVSKPLISPDGKWILFSKDELKWKDNKRERYLWLVSADGGEAFKYINREGDSSSRWSPDGKYLAFLRGKEEKRQVWMMRTSGGEATQITKHKGAVSSFRWSADSQNIIFLANDIKSKEEKEKVKQGDDVVYVYEGHSMEKQGWASHRRFAPSALYPWNRLEVRTPQRKKRRREGRKRKEECRGLIYQARRFVL